MAAHLRLVTEAEHVECAVPSPATTPESEPHPDLPGSRRREWVYREMEFLGSEATPWLETLDD